MVKDYSNQLKEALRSLSKGASDVIPLSNECALIYREESVQAELVFAAFNTSITILLICNEEQILSVSKNIIEECRRYERLFSRTLEHSDVSLLNTHSNSFVKVDDETFNLVKLALYYCDESKGFFDISIGSVSSLWDFHTGLIPNAQDLKQALDLVNYKLIVMDEKNKQIKLAKKGMQIDLGGIAKGYIADKLNEMLIAMGIENFLINLGGNIYAHGQKANGDAWRIGIMNPKEQNKNLAAFTLHNASSVSSGTYERGFTRDSKRYHHILNPKTGYPVDTDVVEASLICKKSIDAEGYSTTMVALGIDAALEFAYKKDEILQCYLVDEENRIYRAK